MRDAKNENIVRIFSEFKANDMRLYDNLYKEYYSTVYGIVFPILRNKENAEDVTQEVFLKIYNIKKENIPEKGELSWLYTVSKNEALQFLRKNKQEINIDEVYEIKEENDDIDKIIDINTYNKIISPLNEIEKQIVSLKILSNFTFKKIGQMLSMPTPTVQWKYYKAVDSLKISIGNFVAFLFTFIILIGRKIFKNNNELKNNRFVYDENSYTESEADDVINKNNEKIEVKDNYTENISKNSQYFGETVSSTEKEINTIDYFEPFLIGISGLFLIISLIFAIFFKKFQQKRIKKTSK